MITKVAQPPYWPKVLQGLRKITNLPPNVREIINAPQRLVFHQATPAGANPMAKAFVSTEDSDDDGNLDTVNMVVTNMEKEIPPDLLSQINQLTETDPAFQEIVSNIAKTLVHELAHIDDYDSEHGFPGGEPIAESKEKSFNPIFASSTTNKNNDNDNIVKHNSKGELKMKQDLVKLANHLDKIGHRDLADRLDLVLKQADQATMGGAANVFVGQIKDEADGASRVAKVVASRRDCTPGPEWMTGEDGPNCGYLVTSLEDLDIDPNSHLYKWLTTSAFDLDLFMQELDGGSASLLDTSGGDNAPPFSDGGGFRFSLEQANKNLGSSDIIEEEAPLLSSPGTGPEQEDEAWDEDEVDDFITATMSSADKINKLADLMAGEFNSGVPGSFYRR